MSSLNVGQTLIEQTKGMDPPVSGTNLRGRWLLFAQMLWVLLALLNLLLFIIASPVQYAVHLQTAQDSFLPALQQVGLSANFYAVYRTTLEVLQAAAFGVIAAIIFRAKPGDWMVMMVSMAILTFGSLFVPVLTQLNRLDPLWQIPVGLLRALGLALSLIALYYLFPDGRFVPRWTKVLAVFWALMSLIWLLFPRVPANLVHLDNWSENLALSFSLFLAAFGSGLFAQIYRFWRVSTPEQRQQTKWVVLGVAAAVAGFFIYHLPLVLMPSLNEPGAPRLMHIFFGVPVYHLLIFLAPLSIGVAVMRYRLWDVDLLINRSLVYSVLSLLLAGIFFGTVVALQQVFQWLFRQESGLVVVVTTLGIASLFDPLRKRVQSGIDRRFYPDKYEADRILTDLSASIRSEVDLNQLTERVENVMWEIVQPTHVLTWMRMTETGYSVYMADRETADKEPVTQPAWTEIPAGDPFIHLLREGGGPLEMKRMGLDTPAIKRLKESHVELVLPLVAQGELIGWITLGPSMSKGVYSAEDRRLLAELALQAAPALRIAQLARQHHLHMLDDERLRHELDVARSIQKTLLPKELPVLEGWEVAVHYQPARAVGGDFYDFLPVPDGRLAIIVGDVSDKGVPAALVMATVRSILRGAAKRLISPAAVLERANELLYPEIPATMFVTCLYILLDPRTGFMEFANAGHNLPYRRLPERVERLVATGMPLGMMPGITYDEYQAAIQTGEAVTLYSDGLVEAHNTWEDMFGMERLEHCLMEDHPTCQAMIDNLLARWADFVGTGMEQEDDITLLVIKYLENRAHEPA